MSRESQAITSISFSTDGNELITASKDSSIKVTVTLLEYIVEKTLRLSEIFHTRPMFL